MRKGPLWQRAKFDVGEYPIEAVPEALRQHLGIFLWVRHGPPYDPTEEFKRRGFYDGVTGNDVSQEELERTKTDLPEEKNNRPDPEAVAQKTLLVYQTNLIDDFGGEIRMAKQFIELHGHDLDDFSWREVPRERFTTAPRSKR